MPGNRNPLHMFHEHNIPLSQEHWEIFYLLIEKSQIDPWTLDFRGENPWHTFCQTCQSSVNLPWMSIAHEFLPILNDQDHFGRTTLFLMSSNSKADLDIFQWHLSNGADLSISANGHNPRLKVLTCLHAAIASLQPRHQKCRFGPLDSNYGEILGGRFGTRKNERPIYDEDDRVTQKSEFNYSFRMVRIYSRFQSHMVPQLILPDVPETLVFGLIV
jgi:hypothetical protein